MTRLYWYLRGYVQFVFTGGFAEDFINALGELGITLPGLQRQGSDLRLSLIHISEPTRP